MEREQEQKTELHVDQNNEQPNNLPQGNSNTAGEGTREESTSSPKDTSKKVVFIGIALLILFLIAFGIVRILPSIISSLAGAGSGLSSIFSPREELEVTLSPSSIATGEKFTLSWAHTNPSATGRYTFTYECGSNFYIEHMYPNERTEKVVCDTPFVLPTRETSLVFTAFLTEENSYADITLFVNFIKEGTNEPLITKEATLTVRNGEAANEIPSATSTPPTNEQPRTPATSTATTTRNPGFNVNDYRWGGTNQNTTPKPTTPKPVVTHKPVTKADLIATNAIVGTINPSTNVFTPGAKIIPGSRVGVQFEVVNNGGTASGNWKLSAVLPTSPAETLQSTSQTNLRAGDKMIFTLTFDNLINKPENSIVVHIDPTNTVSESNENNNTLFITVKQETSNTSSKPDLIINILDHDVNGNDAEIRFKVENRGASFTQNWVFKVDLPFDQTFTSSNQSGMTIGESREFTVLVDNVSGDSSEEVTIKVDTSNKVNESNENNNEDSVTIRF